jgi:multicomponent Na+:H+ antiporter subunit B
MMNEEISFFKRLNDWVNGDEERLFPSKNEYDSPELPEPPIVRGTLPNKDILFLSSYQVIAITVVLGLVFVLLYTVYKLPLFGVADNPAVNEVVERYVEKGLEETGAVNVVAGMILDYRAFDTLGESSVLLLAITSVMMLLLRDKKNIDPEEDLLNEHEAVFEDQSRDVILQNITTILLPAIVLYGIYVILNGHLSPGGGFSGGAILGAGLILYATAFGHNRVRKFFSMTTFRALTTTALLSYGLLKSYSFLLGANHLPTHIPLGVPGAIFSSGLIFVLDICVGLIVACTMYGFYAVFSRGEI